MKYTLRNNLNDDRGYKKRNIACFYEKKCVKIFTFKVAARQIEPMLKCRARFEADSEVSIFGLEKTSSIVLG